MSHDLYNVKLSSNTATKENQHFYRDRVVSYVAETYISYVLIKFYQRNNRNKCLFITLLRFSLAYIKLW